MKYLILMIAMMGCGGSGTVRFTVSSNRPEVQGAGGQARLERLLDVSLAFWGATRSDLVGWDIKIVDGPIYYNGRQAAGFTKPGEIVIDASDMVEGCVETLPLAHEIGHAVRGDPFHFLPTWQEMAKAWGDSIAGSPDTNCRNVKYDGSWYVGHF